VRTPTARWIEPAVVGAAVVAGAVLRFVTTSQLWLDEALSVDIARLPLGKIPDALRHDGHPPLYYFLLHGWMSVFGESNVAVRALSGVFGLLALPLVWFAGKRLGGRPVAWAALLILAVSPFALRYSTETRMYSIVMVLVLAGYLMVAEALERSSWIRLAGIAVVTGLLLLSHYWALWLTGAVVLYLAFVWFRVRGDADPAPRKRARNVLLAVVAGGVFLVPWLGVMRYQSAHTGTPWAPAARPTQIVESTLEDMGGGARAEQVLLGMFMFGLFFFGLCAQADGPNRLTIDLRTVPPAQPEAAVVGMTVVLGAAAGYLTGSTYASRYAAVFFPLFVLVAAVGITRFTGRAARAGVVVLLLSLCATGAYRNVTVDRTQAGDIAAAIKAKAQPGDVVVFCPDQLGPAVHRLLPGSFSQYTYPRFASPDRVDWVDYAERNSASDPNAFVTDLLARAPADATIWLVESGSYRTLEDECPAVDAPLGAARPGGEVVVAENGIDFFEHATLVRYPPASASP
jgi:uncharacterized membrane protein